MSSSVFPVVLKSCLFDYRSHHSIFCKNYCNELCFLCWPFAWLQSKQDQVDFCFMATMTLNNSGYAEVQIFFMLVSTSVTGQQSSLSTVTLRFLCFTSLLLQILGYFYWLMFCFWSRSNILAQQYWLKYKLVSQLFLPASQLGHVSLVSVFVEKGCFQGEDTLPSAFKRCDFPSFSTSAFKRCDFTSFPSQAYFNVVVNLYQLRSDTLLNCLESLHTSCCDAVLCDHVLMTIKLEFKFSFIDLSICSQVLVPSQKGECRTLHYACEVLFGHLATRHSCCVPAGVNNYYFHCFVNTSVELWKFLVKSQFATTPAWRFYFRSLNFQERLHTGSATTT
jgi:hypothetical protein